MNTTTFRSAQMKSLFTVYQSYVGFLRGSLRAMVKNVDQNYDAYRREKSPIKSCFGRKYVCVYEVWCRIVALKSIFCPILRRPRLEMKRNGISQTRSQFTANDTAPVVSISRGPTGTKLVKMWNRRVGVYHAKNSAEADSAEAGFPSPGSPAWNFNKIKANGRCFTVVSVID